MDEAHNIEPLTPPGPNAFSAPAAGQEYDVAATAIQTSPQTSQKSSTKAEDEAEAEAGFVLGYNYLGYRAPNCSILRGLTSVRSDIFS